MKQRRNDTESHLSVLVEQVEQLVIVRGHRVAQGLVLGGYAHIDRCWHAEVHHRQV